MQTPSTAHRHAVTVHARRILDERSLRKQATTDAQHLANRIQHLKDEVARAAKRTKEASSRSVVISMQKVESESRRERSKVHLSKSGVEKKVIEEAGYYGTWIPGGLQGPKVEVKMIGAKELIRMKNEKTAALLALNKKKIEEMKKKRLAMTAAKKVAEEKRVAMLNAQYEAKIAKEQKLREAADMIVAKLEEEENKLIEKLREQQEEQRKSYVQLTETIVGEGGGDEE